MSSCRCQDSFQQCIDWPVLVRYVDNLKTRIYKALLMQAQSEVRYLQSFCITSPLVVLVAAKCYAQLPVSCMNCFELAYLVFSLSSDFHLDASFYCYYREKSIAKTVFLFDSWIEKTKFTVLVWCIKPYNAAALSQKNFLLSRPNGVPALRSLVVKKMPNFKHALLLDLNPCFNYLYLSGLIQKLALARDIELYLLNWLNRGVFSYFTFYSTVFLGSIVLTANLQGLFSEMVDMFISFICSELNIAFCGLNMADRQSEKLVFAYYKSNLLILYQESSMLSILLEGLKNFGLFNGVRLICASSSARSTCCFNSATYSLFSVICQDLFNGLILNTKPSLYAQCALLKRISLMLSLSTAYPSFLLAIRLNKLLCIWSSIYINNSADKVFYLVDYLVCVRVKLFLSKQKANCYNLYHGPLIICKSADSPVFFCSNARNSILAFISAHHFYAQYVSIKIFWIYSLICLSS